MPKVNILFGRETTQKILNNEQLSQEEILEFQKTYDFESAEEAKAFKKGIEVAVGWQEVYVFEKPHNQNAAVSQVSFTKRINYTYSIGKH